MNASRIASNQALEASQDASRFVNDTFHIIRNAQMLWDAKQQACDVTKLAMHDAIEAAGAWPIRVSFSFECLFHSSVFFIRVISICHITLRTSPLITTH